MVGQKATQPPLDRATRSFVPIRPRNVFEDPTFATSDVVQVRLVETLCFTLRRLAIGCLSCGKDKCSGIPVFKGKGSQFLQENRTCCFSWKLCYKCGVSTHDRKTQCFDQSYLHTVSKRSNMSDSLVGTDSPFL